MTMTEGVARARPLEGSSAHVHQSGAQSAVKMAPPMRTHASRGVGEYLDQGGGTCPVHPTCYSLKGRFTPYESE